MAWTTPRTWVTGAILTAGQLNTDIRDNSNFLYSPPRCKVNNDFDTITNNAVTACAFSSEEFDNDGMHSTVSNNNRVTFVTAGFYIAIGNLEWAAHATGIREGILRTGGSSVIANTKVGAASAGDTDFNVAVIRAFSVAEYLELLVKQTSGGNLDVLGLLTLHWLSN